MSKVTKPVVLDETAKQVVAQMQLQNEILTSLASGINYKPTSIKDVFNVVRAGQASKVFQVGDQIIVPWTDIATGQKYDVPLDIVAFGTSALQDGEELPSMTVQWHYATPFGVQFNQYQAFFYATEGLAAGTYYAKNCGAFCPKTSVNFFFTASWEIMLLTCAATLNCVPCCVATAFCSAILPFLLFCFRETFATQL